MVRGVTSTTPDTRWIVRCADGRIRHLSDPTVEHGSFTSHHAACVWADQGHICTAHHTFEEVTPVGTAGCIVLPGIDGPCLWDCECAQCLAIQRQEEDAEGPTCSICDGLGHGYPGGPPCPLEVTDYSGEPWWAL
jgi:hypothetical protein